MLPRGEAGPSPWYRTRMDLLPVFPLDLVVFPGQTVRLLVFEARYKQLVKAVVAMEQPRFVVSLALDGGGRPVADIGTVVSVVELSENPDGSYDLLAHGRDRVRLAVERREDVPEPDGSTRPLYFARCKPLPLRRDDPNDERLAAWDALESFRRYAAQVFYGEAAHAVDEHLPDELLYQASFVCANLRVEAEARQPLLEAPSLVERFRRAERLMDQRLAQPQPGREGRA